VPLQLDLFGEDWAERAHNAATPGHEQGSDREL
jgi:hypothetical protein